MATELENLVAARAGAKAKLAAALTGDYSSAEEFKPDVSGSPSLNRAAYIQQLRDTITWLDKQIAIDDAEHYAAFEVTSEMQA